MFFFFPVEGGRNEIFLCLFFAGRGSFFFFLKERGKYLCMDLFIFLLFSE